MDVKYPLVKKKGLKIITCLFVIDDLQKWWWILCIRNLEWYIKVCLYASYTWAIHKYHSRFELYFLHMSSEHVFIEHHYTILIFWRALSAC